MKGFPQRVLIIGAFLLGGCLSRPSLEKQSFAFAVPPASENSASTGPELGVRRILVASPFDSQALTYRTGAFSYERDPYAQFLAAPDQILIAPVCQYLRNSGFFRRVAEPNSGVTSEVELEIVVLQLYGDFHDHAKPAAVLQMRFLAYRTSKASTDVLLQKEYILNIPLQTRTAAALLAGWNEALREITTEAAGDLKSAVR